MSQIIDTDHTGQRQMDITTTIDHYMSEKKQETLIKRNKDSSDERSIMSIQGITPYHILPSWVLEKGGGCYWGVSFI